MSATALALLVGLTGAGKSTAVQTLVEGASRARLLPNRRELADRIVIPEAQRLAGEPVRPVRDRIARFRLSARYADAHPGGLAHALERYLAARPELASGGSLLLFDNLRGEAEVGYAIGAFPSARFIVLEAATQLRVARLASRGDPFDRLEGAAGAGGAALARRLEAVEGLAQLVDPAELAAATAGLEPESVVTAARVVAEESTHYRPEAAWGLLESLPATRRIRLDTGRLGPSEVVERLRRWL